VERYITKTVTYKPLEVCWNHKIWDKRVFRQGNS